MAADLLARGLATAARDGAVPALRSLADLTGRAIPAGIDTIAVGAGATFGHYVRDALATAALAAAHPRFCKADAAGRCFRLAPAHGAISVEQGGATGSGNDQPAIQATIAYAAAAGIPTVRFLKPAYEVWCPIRTSPYATGFNALDGVPLIVTGDVDLIGRDGGTTLTLKGPTGGARGQVLADGTWYGGGLFYTGAAVTRCVLRNLTLRGGRSFANVYANTESDVYDKGIFLNDGPVPNLKLVDHRDCELTDFGGEIWYMGGPFTGTKVYVENLRLHGSPQSAWNPGTLAQVMAVNLEAGRSYLAAEAFGGPGQTYIGGRFYDAGAGGASFFGGPWPSLNPAYHYSYPFRDDADVPPFVNFIGTRFEYFRSYLNLSSWVRGSIVCVDAGVALNNPGKISDVDLDIEHWTDRTNGSAAVTIGGPPDLTTQVPSCPAGTWFEKPNNIKVRVRCHRTKRALDAGFQVGSGVGVNNGLLDADTCAFSVSGNAKLAWQYFGGAPVAGFKPPKIAIEDFTGTEQPFGGVYDIVSTNQTYRVLWSAMTFYQSFAGTVSIALDTSIGYAQGQRVRFYYGAGAPDRIVSFAASGAGMTLRGTRTLRAAGEYLDLEWTGNQWVEVAYVGQS